MYKRKERHQSRLLDLGVPPGDEKGNLVTHKVSTSLKGLMGRCLVQADVLLALAELLKSEFDTN